MTGSMIIGGLVGLAFGVAIYFLSDRYYLPSLDRKFASEESAAKRALLQNQIRRMKRSLMLNIPLSAGFGAFVLPQLVGVN